MARPCHALVALLLAAMLRCGVAALYERASIARTALEEEATASELAKRHASAAVRHQRAASHAQWNSTVVVVVTWHNRSIEWLTKYGFERSGVTLALYIKGGNHTCDSVPAALRASVAHCEKGFNAEGREAHTMGLFLAQWYTKLLRVTIFVHDDEEYQLAKLRGLDSTQLRAWVHNVEAQPSPLFRNSSTCLCASARENHWRTYGPRKAPMVWFMEHVLGFTNATARWGSLLFPPMAVLAVPARAVLTRPKLVYEIIYALTNGSDVAGASSLPDKWAPQLTFHGWENGNHQRKWAPLSWAHNFERLWVRLTELLRRLGSAALTRALTTCYAVCNL